MDNNPITKGLIARIRNGKTVGALEFQFNPSTLTRAGSVKWQMGGGPGSFLPVPLFNKIGDITFTLDLLFDAREEFINSLEGLRGVLSEAESLALPAIDRWSGSRNSLAVSPDRIQLVMGTRRWNCEITDWEIIEEFWNKKLAPTRARVKYTLQMANSGIQDMMKYVAQIKKFRELYENHRNFRDDDIPSYPFSD